MKSKSIKLFQTAFISLLIIFVVACIVIIFNGSTNKLADYSYEKVNFNGQIITQDGKKYDISNCNFDNLSNQKQITFKGKISNNLKAGQFINITIKDLWVDISIDGTTVVTNKDKSFYKIAGCSVVYIDTELLQNYDEIEIVLNNPYGIIQKDAYKSFFNTVIIGGKDALYRKLFNEESFQLLFATIITLIGVLNFSLCWLIPKSIRNKNLAFALLAFSLGLFILFDNLYMYMPLFIPSPVLCTFLMEGSTIFIVISFIIYLLSIIESDKVKRNMMAIITVIIIIAIVSLALQLLNIVDIRYTRIGIFILSLIPAMYGIGATIMQSIVKKDIKTWIIPISFVPVILSTVFEIINFKYSLAPTRFAVLYGVIPSLILQIISLAISIRNNYEEERNYEKMQSELLRSRVAIMASQIQPHFLYNSLTSIAMLCEKNPKEAKLATIDFADYLRGNMNSLKDTTPVPFEKELQHLKIYLKLEKMRFGEDLKIEWDLNATDFNIPSLTVQPLVENAVKHGVGMKEDGGTVKISTNEYSDRYEVTITDDGVGFDVNKPNPDTTRTHLGISNIKNRIESMINGDVIIESEIGKGTTAKIIIYK